MWVWGAVPRHDLDYSRCPQKLTYEIGDEGKAKHDDDAKNRRHNRQLEGGAINARINCPLGQKPFPHPANVRRDYAQAFNLLLNFAGVHAFWQGQVSADGLRFPVYRPVVGPLQVALGGTVFRNRRCERATLCLRRAGHS